jgi:hypothetical protein
MFKSNTNGNKINLIKPEKINLKDHPILTEAWLQDIIGNSPIIIGLGDLILKDKERKQLNPRIAHLVFANTRTNTEKPKELFLAGK